MWSEDARLGEAEYRAAWATWRFKAMVAGQLGLIAGDGREPLEVRTVARYLLTECY